MQADKVRGALRSLIAASFAGALAACSAFAPGADVGVAGAGQHPDGDAVLRVAERLAADGDHSGALQLYRRAHALTPEDPAPLVGIGRALLALGADAEAAKAYRRAITVDRDSIDGRLGLGRALLRLGRADEALTAFAAAREQAPEDYRPLNGMAVALDAMEDHAAAQRTYRQAATLAPHVAAIRNNLGLSLALSGALDEAAAVLAGAVRMKDAKPRHRLNLALVYGLMGDEQRLAGITEALPANPETGLDTGYYERLSRLPKPDLVKFLVHDGNDPGPMPAAANPTVIPSDATPPVAPRAAAALAEESGVGEGHTEPPMPPMSPMSPMRPAPRASPREPEAVRVAALASAPASPESAPPPPTPAAAPQTDPPAADEADASMSSPAVARLGPGIAGRALITAETLAESLDTGRPAATPQNMVLPSGGPLIPLTESALKEIGGEMSGDAMMPGQSAPDTARDAPPLPRIAPPSAPPAPSAALMKPAPRAAARATASPPGGRGTAAGAGVARWAIAGLIGLLGTAALALGGISYLKRSSSAS